MSTHLDLFSGIGGFALAAHWAGFQTIGFCENEKFCQRVLAKHWPGTPCHDDIRTLDGHRFAGIDLLTAGVPCQPASCAGKRLGEADDRWLWPEALRILREAAPVWALFENPGGLDSLGDGVALRALCAEVEGAGYEVQPFCIPACAAGAFHIRERIWLVAHAQERESWEPSTGNGRQGAGRGSEEAIADRRRAELAGRAQQSAWEERETVAGSGEEGGECTGSTQPGVCRDFHGLPARLDLPSWETLMATPMLTTEKLNRRPRLKALGNAIVPQVAYQILKAIHEH